MKVKDRFLEYFEYLRKKGLTEKTIREHQRFIFGAVSHAELLAEKEIKQIRLIDTASVIEAGRQHGAHGSTRAVCVWRNYLKFLEELGVKLPFNWTRIKVPPSPYREQPVLSKEELLEVLDGFPLNSRNAGARKMAWTMKALCEVLFGTTMRIFEALSLKRKQWSEIKEKKETTIKGKGGNERRVYFTDRAICWLDKYLNQRNDTSEAMFVNSYGEPLKMVTAKSYLLKYRKKFGEKGNKIKFHTFRRTSTTFMLERGMDLKSVQVIGGWKSERTILRHYAIANRSRAKKEHLRILGEI